MGDSGIGREILLEASGCHIHLTKEAVEVLFGKGAGLTKRRDLSQPGEYLCEERLKIVTKDGVMDRVAVLGPVREHIQVELSKTDCRKLGIQAPINLSGDLQGAIDVTLVGPAGQLIANKSGIVAKNHIHMRPCDAAAYGIKSGDAVDVLVEGGRSLMFKAVPVRIKESFMPAMHIDFDEANACGFGSATTAYIMPGAAAAHGLEEKIRQIVRELISGHRGEQIFAVDCKLITETEARRLLNERKEQCFGVKKGTIITPLAKDLFRSNQRMIRVE